jgi:hypothetical protein
MRRAAAAAALSAATVTLTAPAVAQARYSRVGPFDPAKPAVGHTAAEAVPATNTIPTWRGVVMHPTLRLPMQRHGSRLYWNPVTVTLYGLQEYNLHMFGGRRDRLAGSRRVADWLVRNQTPDGAWEYKMPFAYPREEVPLAVPWVAAQAQGNALSLLVRVWRRGGDARYAAAAGRALGPFQRPVGARGVRRTIGGHVLFEGFPTRSPSLPLEDFQLALIGLYDFAPYSRRARRLLNDGLAGLSWALPWYTDERGDALIDLRHYGGNTWKEPDPDAHSFNAHVLATLAQLTGRPRLARYAALWIHTIDPAEGAEATISAPTARDLRASSAG